MQTFKGSLLLWFGALLTALPVRAAEGVLTIGSPAPELRVARWVKGPEVEKLEKGSVYVVEFWATWCGPCRAAMPHLSELARQYAGRVTVISVDVLEGQGGGLAHLRDKKVDDFVKGMGKDMDYAVARDADENGYMFTRWMRAAYQMGIPCGFVVDAKGRIAWIGQPSFGLAEALPKILDGTFDYQAEAARVAAEQARSRPQQEASDDANGTRRAIEKLIADQQWQPAMAKIEETLAKHPDRTYLESFKFQPLLRLDEPRALAMLRANLAQGGTYGVYQAGVIGSSEYLSPEAYALAISILELAIAKAEKPVVRDLAGLALAYFHTGQPAKAAALQQQVLQLVNEGNTSPDRIEKYRGTLRKFEAAAGNR